MVTLKMLIVFIDVFSLFIPRPLSRAEILSSVCMALRPCVHVSFPDYFSETVSRIVFILHSHIP